MTTESNVMLVTFKFWKGSTRPRVFIPDIRLNTYQELKYTLNEDNDNTQPQCYRYPGRGFVVLVGTKY